MERRQSEGIVIRGLCQYYGKKQALTDIDLTIGKGMFGLLGRNGAGKTTLMKTLTTLLPLRSGEVSVCGIPLSRAGEIRKMTGYLPQEFSMYPSMTVEAALDYLGILSGLPGPLRRERAAELLERVNLTEQRKKKVKALSGGMKRRLGIAQALLHDPKVLIVDEPTAGLDPEERIRFRNLLCDVAEERIVILSTHIAADVEAACGTVAVLDGGRVIYSGTVEHFLENSRGKVYTCRLSRKELPLIREHYTVTAITEKGTDCIVRFLADSADVPKVAESCEPGVEDAYMYCLHRGKSGENGPAAGPDQEKEMVQGGRRSHYREIEMRKSQEERSEKGQPETGMRGEER